MTFVAWRLETRINLKLSKFNGVAAFSAALKKNDYSGIKKQAKEIVKTKPESFKRRFVPTPFKLWNGSKTAGLFREVIKAEQKYQRELKQIEDDLKTSTAASAA